MSPRTPAGRPAIATGPIGVLIVVSWLAVLPATGRADFGAGLAADDAGDYRTAFAEWRPLAEAGDAEAQAALAGLYHAGQGVPRDLEQAIHWYRRAAQAGDPVAQLNLGDFYGRGEGVPRDLVEAYVWLSLSAAQGRIWPDLRRADIAALMTAEQRAKAEARLETWRSSR